MFSLLNTLSPQEQPPFNLGEALGLGSSGFTIVVLALAALAVIVVILGKLAHKKNDNTQNVQTAVQPTPPTPPVAPTAPAQPVAPSANTVPTNCSQDSIDLYGVDDKTAAMLMAIVADDLNVPLNELYFKTIREVRS